MILMCYCSNNLVIWLVVFILINTFNLCSYVQFATNMSILSVWTGFWHSQYERLRKKKTLRFRLVTARTFPAVIPWIPFTHRWWLHSCTSPEHQLLLADLMAWHLYFSSFCMLTCVCATKLQMVRSHWGWGNRIPWCL